MKIKDEQTIHRFRQLKFEVSEADPHLPELSDSVFLESLMDTWDKVDRVGYGTEGDVERSGGEAGGD